MAKFQSFDGFAIVVYEGSEWIYTKYFDGITDASKEAADEVGKGHKVKMATCNKWGALLDVID